LCWTYHQSVSLNCYLYKFFTFLFHHCQLLVITHPSWLLDHFTIQVVVSISHLSPFSTVFTEFNLNWICKEFVKVTIQWNWLVICSTQIQGIFDFLFDVLFFFAHSCIFVSPFPDDQPQNEMKTVMNQPIDKMVNQYFRWRCELLENSPIQGEFRR
jgi:hypothetical protein